jgi:hypothetical protein
MTAAASPKSTSTSAPRTAPENRTHGRRARSRVRWTCRTPRRHTPATPSHELRCLTGTSLAMPLAHRSSDRSRTQAVTREPKLRALTPAPPPKRQLDRLARWPISRAFTVRHLACSARRRVLEQSPIALHCAPDSARRHTADEQRSYGLSPGRPLMRQSACRTAVKPRFDRAPAHMTLQRSETEARHTRHTSQSYTLAIARPDTDGPRVARRVNDEPRARTR